MRFTTRSFLIALVTAAMACGCASTPAADGPNVLHVLAGSEVKDLEPMLPDLRAATGVDVRLTYSGTIEGIDRIESGGATPDAAWFAQDRYFALVDDKHLAKASEKTMISPVVLGVKASKARDLGWHNGTTTWQDIAEAVGAGKFRYAMTSPTTSNSGFSAVLGITAAFAGTGNAAATKDVDEKRLSAFFAGQKIFSGSSGWLADAYIKDEATVDGMINYESVILGLGGKTREPLVVIAPKDGTVIADYPLVLLNVEKKAAYDKVLVWLRDAKTQQRIMEQTHRRPITAAVPLAAEFGTALLIDTPFPASRRTVDSVVLGYLDKQRVPAHTIYVLDKTGSMQQNDGTGETRIERVREALGVLTGSDQTLTGQLAKFDDREEVTIMTFSQTPEVDRTFTMRKPNDQAVFAGVREIGDSLAAGGGTAIYDALERALIEADTTPPGRYTSIVLMTDGENNRGESQAAFLRRYQQRKNHVRIFAVGIGESNAAELSKITDATGGRYFDARTQRLADVFKDVRGYQ